jgi:prolyl-tRNA editing enzyme YbaK/EbsC (Cys-tRNA(Pro) deacylase)
MGHQDILHPRVAQALRELGIRHEVLEVEPEYADTANFCAHYGYPLETSGNAIIVTSTRGPKVYAACVVQATLRVDVNHAVRQLIGASRASFASAEETIELTGMPIGGVTPIGLPPGLPIYVDERILGLEYVMLSAGTRRGKLKTWPDELRKVPGLQYVAGVGLESGNRT